MRAGLLTKKIEIYKAEKTVSKTGSKVSTWGNLFGDGKQIHARATYGQQKMAAKNGNFVLTSDITFTIRYYSAINEYMRVYWEGRKYRITAIRRYPERGEMQIDGELIDE